MIEAAVPDALCGMRLALWSSFCCSLSSTQLKDRVPTDEPHQECLPGLYTLHDSSQAKHPPLGDWQQNTN